MAEEKPETTAVSAGRMSAEHFGTVNTPVYRTSTILHSDLASLKAELSDGKLKRYAYGRLGTPTTVSFEEAVSALEGAARTVSLPSGLNAITTAILAVCSADDHLLMTVQDIPAISAAAHEHGIAVLMDNTWATPFFFPALKRGVDLDIHAATKYICGHSDTMMGTISANEANTQRLVSFVNGLGLYASGDDCFLALRGLRPLAVRLKRHQETAMRLASWLEERPEVSRVLYPALESDPGHVLWKRDFLGASGLFGVVLKPVSERALAAMIDGLKHFGIGYSWGGYESLIIPAEFVRTATTFQAEGPVIRLHAGLEHPDDLLSDLATGFARMNA